MVYTNYKHSSTEVQIRGDLYAVSFNSLVSFGIPVWRCYFCNFFIWDGSRFRIRKSRKLILLAYICIVRIDLIVVKAELIEVSCSSHSLNAYLKLFFEIIISTQTYWKRRCDFVVIQMYYERLRSCSRENLVKATSSTRSATTHSPKPKIISLHRLLHTKFLHCFCCSHFLSSLFHWEWYHL